MKMLSEGKRDKEIRQKSEERLHGAPTGFEHTWSSKVGARLERCTCERTKRRKAGQKRRRGGKSKGNKFLNPH